MRESRPLGSVRGVPRKGYSYRETGAKIFQFSVISQLDFASYQQQTAEDGLIFKMWRTQNSLPHSSYIWVKHLVPT